MKLQKIYFIIWISVVFATSLFAGCSFIVHSATALQSTNHFFPHPNDERVLYEPGAESMSNKIVIFLPAAIEQVEEKHFRPIPLIS